MPIITAFRKLRKNIVKFKEKKCFREKEREKKNNKKVSFKFAFWDL